MKNMKKKFKNYLSALILIFAITTFFISYTSAAQIGPRCYALFDQIKKDNFAEWKEKKLHYVQLEDFIDFGFEFGFDYLKDEEPAFRNKTNHLIIQLLNDPSLAGKVERGDVVLSIGDTDTSKVEDDNIYKFFSDQKDKEIVRFLRNGKEFKLELPKLERSKEDERILIEIYNISDVNIKNSTFTLKMQSQFIKYYDLGVEDLKLGELIFENIIFKDEEGEWTAEACHNIIPEKMNELRLPFPGEDVKILNTTLLNKNLTQTDISIYAYSEKLGDELYGGSEYASLNTRTNGTYVIQNDFKLQTFPFDKQVLRISFGSPGKIDDFELTIHHETYEKIDWFLKNKEINGWDIKSYDLYNYIVKNESGNFTSRTNIDIHIERQHGYYIYKVLFPILLILMVCWIVVWVHPRELESRLTITIVCLLSLIAYNFVIDSELPKLEYLTVMDWIILISYVYATIPNFISVISFRLYKSNRRLSDKIENYSKKYGLSSYVLIIIMTVLINANLFPQNSSSLISWMGAN